MKIQYMSDLHLEYPENRNYFRENPVKAIGDVLVLAGDIVCEKYREENQDFFLDLEEKFELIISIKGNHEFYHDEIDYAYPSFNKKLAENHFLLNNRTLIKDNVRFIASTLWSMVEPQHQTEIGRRLNDYRYIMKKEQEKYRNLTVYDTNYYHQKSKEFLISELDKDFSGKTVVITHHLPSYQCVKPKWRGSNLASAFVSHLDSIIAYSPIDLWIFGHQHEFIDSTFLGTRFVENPLGYHHEEIFHLFDSQRIVEI